MSAILRTMSKWSAIVPMIAGLLGIWFGLPGQYWLLWAGTICIGIAIGIALGFIKSPRKKMNVLAMGDGTYQLLPLYLREERFWTFAIPLGVAAIAGLVLIVHFIIHVHLMSSGDHAFIVITGLLALMFAGHVIKSAWIARYFQQPRVTLATNRLALNEPFEIRVDIQAIRPFRMANLHARIRCFEHVLMHMGRFTQVVVRLHSEQIVELAREIEVSPARQFSTTAPVLLDSARNLPTGKKGITMYPFYRWEIGVEITGDSASTTIFPITIIAPPAQDK
jgi:hypothetical protein